MVFGHGGRRTKKKLMTHLASLAPMMVMVTVGGGKADQTDRDREGFGQRLARLAPIAAEWPVGCYWPEAGPATSTAVMENGHGSCQRGGLRPGSQLAQRSMSDANTGGSPVVAGVDIGIFGDGANEGMALEPELRNRWCRMATVTLDVGDQSI